MTANQGGGDFDVATDIQYAPFGDVTSLTYGNGHTLSVETDQAYRLESLDVPGVMVRDYGRDSRGNITSVGFSSSTTDKTFSYDQVSRLTGATGPFGSYTYRFDKNGNRLSVNEGSATTYQYHSGTNRISGFNGASASLSYDGLGNLVENGSNDLVYGPDDRLAEFGPSGSPAASFLHMPDGRRLEKLPAAEAAVLYHHDQAGNLITETRVTDPNGVENPTLEYIYLGSQRLALVTSQDASGAFLPAIVELPVSGGGPWYAELVTSEGLKAALWTLLGLSGVSLSVASARRRPQAALTVGLLLAAGTGAVLWMRATPSAEAIATPSNVYFFHNGHLGEPLALTDSQGDVVWSTEYKPYGELINETGSVTIGDPNTTGIEWTPSFRFPGQMADPETGLHYNHWRYYQPGLGNYTRPDPLFPANESLHLYNYAWVNPQLYVDPTGLLNLPCILGWTLGGAAGGAAAGGTGGAIGGALAGATGGTFALPGGGTYVGAAGGASAGASAGAAGGAALGGIGGLLGGLWNCDDPPPPPGDDAPPTCPKNPPNVIPFPLPKSAPAPPPPPTRQQRCAIAYLKCDAWVTATDPSGRKRGLCMDALGSCNATDPLPFIFPPGNVVY